jgi:hypothetical protein
MNAEEATQLLTVISAQDPRVEVNPAIALSWSWLLEDLSLDVAKRAFASLVDAGDTSRITPAALRKYAQPHLRRIATDVRSAKIRGLIPQDWPPTRPLPAAAQSALAREWSATNDASELHAGDPTRGEIEA